jgi:hypothetical protein
MKEEEEGKKEQEEMEEQLERFFLFSSFALSMSPEEDSAALQTRN